MTTPKLFIKVDSKSLVEPKTTNSLELWSNLTYQNLFDAIKADDMFKTSKIQGKSASDVTMWVSLSKDFTEAVKLEGDDTLASILLKEQTTKYIQIQTEEASINQGVLIHSPPPPPTTTTTNHSKI